ncbi:MAG: 3D domain-containing protein [Oscillospiraceae bacterium]|nr:3D domain-containing protein [Oscillospiraceae bacterium]
MYRLVRKFRARVKTHEIILLCVVLVFALIFGRGAGQWYQSTGRSYSLVASVNAMGGAHGAVPFATGGEPDEHGEQAAYDLLAAGDSDITGGFFASNNRSWQLQPAGGYSASYLSLLGDASAQGADATAQDGQYERPGDGEDNPAYRWEDGEDDTEGVADHEGSADIADPPVPTGSAGHADAPGGTGDPDGAAPGADSGGTRGSGSQPPANEPEAPLYTVKVIYYGDRHVFQTVSKKVSELFAENGIFISGDDKITGAYLDGTIDSDLYIEVKRVTQKTIYEEVKIPAKIVYRDNPEITGGQSKVIRNSSDGLKRIEYLLTYENGVQISKTAVKEEVITEAVSGIIEQGSTGTRTGKGGVEFTYSKVIDVKCTAYTSSYEDTGKRPGDPGFGITKSGEVAREGLVAVDPSVIPLGTKMYIEILDEGVEDYGFAVAADTGGKIKGKKVDLYFDASREKLLQFGVRKAKVYIID